MADLSITASAVRGAKGGSAIAAATLTAGVVCFMDPANSSLLTASDCNNIAAAIVHGITLNGGDAGQPLNFANSGQVTVNAVLTAGTFYYLSATAGKICPLADLATGCRVIQLGFAISTTVLQLSIQDTGIVLP